MTPFVLPQLTPADLGFLEATITQAIAHEGATAEGAAPAFRLVSIDHVEVGIIGVDTYHPECLLAVAVLAGEGRRSSKKEAVCVQALFLWEIEGGKFRSLAQQPLDEWVQFYAVASDGLELFRGTGGAFADQVDATHWIHFDL